MGNRLTQIATRTGDDGTTGLGDNTRVSKNSLRVHAMGDVDELNSHIGLLLCEPCPRRARAADRGAAPAVQPGRRAVDPGL
jgi:cob(I)alamin adenosyltransferase